MSHTVTSALPVGQVPLDTLDPREAGPYLLRCSLESRKRGEPVYFEQWTQIGPALTSALNSAALFVNRRAAIESRAYSFPLCFFEPILEVDALEELASAYGVTAYEMKRHLAAAEAA